jgi:hypothetical protein
MTMENSLRPQPLPTEIVVVPWEDPVVEALGHWPGDPYVEYCTLGALGPTTTFLWMRLARTCTAGTGTRVDVVDLAVSLGLGEGLGANAPLPRSLGRLVQFGCAQRAGEALAVRRALPHLSQHQLSRLSRSARRAHEHLVGVAPRTSR